MRSQAESIAQGMRGLAEMKARGGVVYTTQAGFSVDLCDGSILRIAIEPPKLRIVVKPKR